MEPLALPSRRVRANHPDPALIRPRHVDRQHELARPVLPDIAARVTPGALAALVATAGDMPAVGTRGARFNLEPVREDEVPVHDRGEDKLAA